MSDITGVPLRELPSGSRVRVYLYPEQYLGVYTVNRAGAQSDMDQAALIPSGEQVPGQICEFGINFIDRRATAGFTFVPCEAAPSPADSQEPITLDPADPFEAILVEIVETNRRKRADYTSEGSSPWENFDRTEEQVAGFHGVAVETLIATKQARLRALRSRGNDPQNESIADTLLDRAVYSIIALARSKYPSGKVTP